MRNVIYKMYVLYGLISCIIVNTICTSVMAEEYPSIDVSSKTIVLKELDNMIARINWCDETQYIPDLFENLSTVICDTEVVIAELLRERLKSQEYNEIYYRLVEKILAVTNKIGKSDKKSESLLQTAIEIAKVNPDKAIPIFEQATKSAFANDSLLHKIALELVKINSYKAIEVATSIYDKYELAFTLNDIALEIVKVNPDSAVQIVKLIKDDVYINLAFHNIALALSETNPDKAVEIAKMIDSSYSISRTLRKIALKLSETDPEKAILIYDQIIEIIHKIEDADIKHELIRDIAPEVVGINYNKAIEITNIIENPDKKAEVLNIVEQKGLSYGNATRVFTKLRRSYLQSTKRQK